MRIQLKYPPISADIPVWRLLSLLFSFLCVFVVWRVLHSSSLGGGPLEMIAAVLFLFAGIMGAGVGLGIASVGTFSRPLTNLFENLFYPTEVIRQPPPDLLRALRQRLRDRFWESVDQQTLALIDAYGPSAELFHLRAHLAAGRDGNYNPVTAAAAAALSTRSFDRYLALLHRDPPPAGVQLGIDA